MLRYVLKRILIFIPTLFAISLITFFISVNAPGDPVESMLNRSSGGEGFVSTKLANEKAYEDTRHSLGLDLPLFYLTFTNATYPDTLYRVSHPQLRSTLERLAFTYGKWENVSAYYLSIKKFENEIYAVQRTSENAEALTRARRTAELLYQAYDEKKINALLNEVRSCCSAGRVPGTLAASFEAVGTCFLNMTKQTQTWKRYMPAVHWNGLQNQYHRWITHFIAGDFGISYQDKRPVSSVISDALPWTIGLSLTSILIAYLIAIPLGVRSAIRKGTLGERATTTTLFIFYSLPNFWIATLLVIFLCGGDYLSWFPAPGSPAVPEDASFLVRIGQGLWSVVLPLFCWTYGSLAFISRQMRGGMLEVIHQDYIRTARAKGLEERTITWKHGLRNSLIPIITLFAQVFPLAISGSFVIEFIFSIPGLGKVSYYSLVARDYPVIFTITMLVSTFTIIGMLVADILYAAIDPRISFSKRS